MNHTRNPSVDNELFESGSDFAYNKLTKKEKQITWRRQAIFNLLVRGVTSTYQIAATMKISQSTAARDIQFLKAQATEQLKFHIQERLPWEHKICSEGLSQIIKHTWSIILEGDAKTNKIAALSLIAQCYKDRLEIATNAHVVTEALQHVETMKNQNITQKQAISDKS